MPSGQRAERLCQQLVDALKSRYPNERFPCEQWDHGDRVRVSWKDPVTAQVRVLLNDIPVDQVADQPSEVTDLARMIGRMVEKLRDPTTRS